MLGFAPLGTLPVGTVPVQGTIAYTLAGATGAFALTGANAGLKTARKLAAGTGSFALTGANAAFATARKLAGGAGAFSLTGSTLAVSTARKLAAAAGSFALTGSNAGAVTARKLAGGTGSFALTGASANLDAPTRHLDGAAGSFSLTGKNAGLATARKVAGTTGAFTLTGSSASPSTARKLAGATGSISITGSAAVLVGKSPPIGPVALLLQSAQNGNQPILGTYYAPQSDIFDLGYVGTLNLNVTWQASGSPADANIIGSSDILGQTDIFGVAAAASMLSWPIVNIGVPDGQGGIAWAGWQKFTPGTYQGQYAWFGVTVEAPSAQVQGALLAFNAQASVPARIDHYQNLSIASGGTTITFIPDGATSAAPFNKGPNGASLPFVLVTYNNQSGDVLSVTSLSLSGVTIEILNSGVGVARSGVNVTVEGY